MWKNDSCWVVTYRGTNVLTEKRPAILTFKTKYEALKVFQSVVGKLKKTYKKLSWTEDIKNPNNNKIKVYSLEATTNPDIYVKAYKSKHTQVFGWETEKELLSKGLE